MFKVSDKVVRMCPMKRKNRVKWKVLGAPMRKGRVYVVEGIEEYDYEEGVATGLYLVGCHAIWLPRNENTPWCSEFFRKLEEVREENREAKQEPVEA